MWKLSNLVGMEEEGEENNLVLSYSMWHPSAQSA